MTQLTKPRLDSSSAVLLTGDLLCFLLFAVLGLRSHEDGITASSLLRAAVPFQAGWLAVTLLMGLKGRRVTSEPQTVLVAWLPAWAIGLALRSLVFGRAFAPTFAVISFLVNLVLLLLWRTVLASRLSKAD